MSRAPTKSGAGFVSATSNEPPKLVGAGSDFELFRGNSEMAVRMRAVEWSTTPLGPVSRWPQSLRSAISILLASKTQIVLFWGPDLVALYNDAYIDVFGSKHPWALGKPARECWAEIWDETLGPLFAGVLRSGEAFHAQDHPFFLERQGFLEETYFDVSYDPVRVEGGDVGGIFCIVSERTDRVLERRRLRTLRDLSARSLSGAKTVEEVCRAATATITANGQDFPFALIYQVDAANRVARLAGAGRISLDTPASPAIASLDVSDTAMPLQKVYSSNCPQLIYADELPELPASAWGDPPRSVLFLPVAALGQEAPVAILVVGINPRRPLDELYQNFIQTVAGHISMAVANAQAYEAERKRVDALAELDRAKTAFFSNVSHEFRTPLTLMLGPTEDLLSGSDLPSPARPQLEVIYRNSLRLVKLVNTLLDFSRIEAGRADAAYEPIDIASLTADVASGFRSAVQKGGMELHVDCPPLSRPVFVDRSMFEKIILNLLSNAFKFTFHGRIAVSVRDGGDRAELVVSDTGVGIPEKEIPRVFDRFYRVRGVNGRTYEGTGIGLALVQELVKLHGGTIHAESKVGRGSTFSVSLPFGHVHLPSESVNTVPSRSGETASRAYVEEALSWLSDAPSADTGASYASGETAPARILLADDNADMRDYVGRLLRTHYQVETVADGVEAVAALERAAPDLILSDVLMPGLDGFGLLKHIRASESTRDIPFILLSARAGEESRIEGLQVGADDYLVKPFNGRELLTRVGVHLRLAHKRREGAELASEHAALVLLHQLSTKLSGQDPLPDLFQAVCDAAVAISGAQKGVFQLFDPVSNNLRVVAQHGFEKPFIDSIELTPNLPSGLSQVATAGSRVIVEDLSQSAAFAGTPVESILEAERVGAVQSTPLVAASGQLLGVVSTHWASPHHPDESTLRSLDLLAYEAAQLIEKRQREEALRESEERFRKTFEHAATGIAITNLEGLYVRCNPAYCSLSGYTSEELLKTKWTSLIHPQDRERNFLYVRRLMAGKLPSFEIESRYVKKSGEAVWVRKCISLLRDANGEPTHVLALVTDVTARRQAEEMLRRAQETLEHRVNERTRELRESETALRALSAALLTAQEDERRRIARDLHDDVVRQLALLSLEVGALTGDLPSPNDYARSQIRALQDRLMQLTQVVRDLSHGLHPSLIDSLGLNAALRALGDEFRQVRGLDVHVDASVDDASIGSTVASVLYRIAEESMTNAARHAHPRTIRVELRRAGKFLELVVADDGTGFDPTRAGRSGLGLVNMRERVRLVNGSMSVASWPGHGTSIRAAVPLDGGDGSRSL